MVYEFEGRTEKEAIDRAAEELGLEKDDFDVEILETQRQGLFKKGFVKIRVHTEHPTKFPPDKPVAAQGERIATGRGSSLEDDDDSIGNRIQEQDTTETDAEQFSQAVFGDPEAKNDFEQKMIDFVEGLIDKMGYGGKVSFLFREDRKIGLKIDSQYSSILIGKKGKNLDALQLLANIYAGRQGREDMRVILDSENYRIRREESLVRLAYTVADRVRDNRGSILLEPMNPFDRRLIHTTLNDIADVETKSEGEGLYKQVRVYYRGLR
ncbi:single-stranded DNA-binding protein [Spirochaetia bacterium]|nr:single-stranded DNA-binding protein [Spirochaetia bacterium]